MAGELQHSPELRGNASPLPPAQAAPYLVHLPLLWGRRSSRLLAQGMAEVEVSVTEAAVTIHIVQALPHHPLLLQEALIRHQQVEVALGEGTGTVSLATKRASTRAQSPPDPARSHAGTAAAEQGREQSQGTATPCALSWC